MIFLKELKMCLFELSLVDDTIEVIGTPKNYQRLRKWIIRIIIGWIIYIFFQLAVIYFDQLYNNINYVDIHRWFTIDYPIYIHILSGLIWGTIIGLVNIEKH